MKLVHSEWEIKIDFDESLINTLVIEEPKYFRRVVGELLNQSEGREGYFTLSNSNKILDINKKTFILTDLFDLSSSLKKVNSKVNQYFKIQSSYLLEETMEMISGVESFVDNLMQEVDLPILRTNSIRVDDIIKSADLHIDIGCDLIENIINIIESCVVLMDIRLFVFINLHSIMSTCEVGDFLRTLRLKKINALIIESKKPEYECVDNEGEKLYIIDDELCEI